jgi:HAE1 family hydrophobic/amphiphilic exporter-1
MKLPGFSVERPVTISMLIGIIIVLGLFSLYHLGLEMLPDISYPVVSVVTSYPGASPEDIEQALTRPIEQMVSTVSNVKSVKSTSQEGVSVVMVEFTWGTNLDFAAQDMRDQLAMYTGFLPEDAGDPGVYKFDISQMPIMMYAVSGPGDLSVLRQQLEGLSDRIERLDGIASVMFFGGEKKEVSIELSPERVEGMKLSPNAIVQALYFNNINVPAGYMDYRHKEFVIRTAGEYKSLDDIGQIVVGVTPAYQPIRLKDVANIKWGNIETRGAYLANGKPAVWMMVTKESGANTVTATKNAIEALNKLKQNFPQGVVFYEFFQQADFIEQIVNSTAYDGIIGGLLAILLIWIFLRNWRPTFAIGLAIPLSVIATFIPMYFMKFTLNMTTMGGLALGVGMLVDNAVVVIENIFRHIELGDDRKRSASIGADEVGMAISASTFTTIAVFLPMLFAGGITAKLSQGYALTVTFSLLASLFVALTLVPMIASKLFKTEKTASFKKQDTRFNSVRNFYKKTLRWVMSHQKVVFITVCVAIAVSIGLVALIGAEFIPTFDSEMFSSTVTLPVGSSLNETVNMAKSISDRVMVLKDVELVGISAGTAEGSEYDLAQGQGNSGSNQAQVFVRLKGKAQRKMTSRQVGDYMRNLLPDLKGVSIQIMDLTSQMMGSANSKPLEIKLFGKDLDKLKTISDKIIADVRNVPGAKDLDINLKEGKPEYVIRVDREKASLYGLSVGEVAQTVKTYTLGTQAGYFRSEGEEYIIRVKFPKEYRSTLEDLKSLPIVTMAGGVIPLGQIAEVKNESARLQIFREDQTRVVTITGNIEGRSLSEVSGDVQKELDKLEKAGVFPPGYYTELKGEYENMKNMLRDLAIAALAAFLLIYMVMAAQFESFSHPLVIMFTVPLSIIGVVFGLAITGYRISLPSMLGFIILAGIVVNNGIVYVDFINQLRKKGVEKREAIVEAGGLRLRPILITAITTILGMIPMAIDKSEGSEFRAPMAVAIVGGLTTATFLTLYIIPILYSWMDRFSSKLQKRMLRIFFGKEEAEKVVIE